MAISIAVENGASALFIVSADLESFLSICFVCMKNQLAGSSNEI